MDYDGFHQMVLGANLKSVKKGDVINPKPSKSRPLNMIAATSKDASAATEAVIVSLSGAKLEEVKMTEPRNQEEFDKYFTKKLTNVADKYK